MVQITVGNIVPFVASASWITKHLWPQTEDTLVTNDDLEKSDIFKNVDKQTGARALKLVCGEDKLSQADVEMHFSFSKRCERFNVAHVADVLLGDSLDDSVAKIVAGNVLYDSNVDSKKPNIYLCLMPHTQLYIEFKKSSKRLDCVMRFIASEIREEICHRSWVDGFGTESVTFDGIKYPGYDAPWRVDVK
jgi:hypothetical protein